MYRTREPGIERHKRGQGFYYIGPDHKRITEERVLARIRKLAIPPAYTRGLDLHQRERGHLQATGRDARRRKRVSLSR